MYCKPAGDAIRVAGANKRAAQTMDGKPRLASYSATESSYMKRTTPIAIALILLCASATMSVPASDYGDCQAPTGAPGCMAPSCSQTAGQCGCTCKTPCRSNTGAPAPQPQG